MKSEKKTIAVLGLGKYGRSLAETLFKLGEDVLVADNNENLIRDIAPKVTTAICCDLSNEDEVLTLGLQNMDIVIICMGGNIAASIVCASIAKEKGVPTVIAKAASSRMQSILKRVGVDTILDPERERGERTARIIASRHLQDYIVIDENLCMIEIHPMKQWVGQTLIELDLRKKNNMNVAAIKENGGKWKYVDPARTIREDDLLMIMVEKDDIAKWKK